MRDAITSLYGSWLDGFVPALIRHLLPPITRHLFLRTPSVVPSGDVRFSSQAASIIPKRTSPKSSENGLSKRFTSSQEMSESVGLIQ